MAKSKVVWTRQATEDLRAVQGFIGRDAPRTARRFIEEIRECVGRLAQFPELGQIVPELKSPEVRELLFGTYRIIYRVRRKSVAIVTVYHSARLLHEGWRRT